MKIIVAPNAFKGSLTAFEAADAIERGVRRFYKQARIVKKPLADGGDGTMEVLARATGGSVLSAAVTGPLGAKAKARYALLGGGETAVIEMAEASGLRLVKRDERNPMAATTFGTGELIIRAIEKGCNKIILGIGGSATNEGGSGMLLALGFRLVNKKGSLIGYGGNGLLELARVENPELCGEFKALDIRVASDVKNLLLGSSGASRMFGPQKGATPAMVDKLETALANYARVIKRDLGVDVLNLKGGGAAGGIGAGIYAFLGGRMCSGIDVVMDLSRIGKELKGAALLITGEGMIDDQSIFGKAPVGVARLAKQHGVPVLCIAGGIGGISRKIYGTGISGISTLVNAPMELESAIRNASTLLADAAERAVRIISIGKRIR